MTWNSSVAIESHYQYGGSCPASTHCVPVGEVSILPADMKDYFCGRVLWKWDSSNHFIDGRVQVQLNNAEFTANCTAGRAAPPATNSATRWA